MKPRFNILFKIACASMFTGVSLGAKYGHIGQLQEYEAELFNKGQMFNTMNCKQWVMQLWD